MSFDKPIRRIAVVGTGVIGASWSAQYFARGFDVVATDPAANAEANLRKYVDDAWEQLEAIGLSPGASRDRLSFTKDMKQALAQADFVQENGPERPDFKTKFFAEMDEAAPADSIIASSSSGITPSVMQAECKHPERVLIGHPFNPPHIIPLVEVVGGARHHRKRSSGQWRSTRRSARSQFICGRNFPGTWRTACKQRSIGRCFTSLNKAC